MPSGSLSASTLAHTHRAPSIPAHRGSRSDTSLCRPILDQILRQTVISRLRLAHTEAAVAAAEPAARGHSASPSRTADAALITRLGQRLRRGSQREIDSLAEAVIQKFGVEDFFAAIAPRVDAILRRQTETAVDGSQDAALAQWRLQELLQRLTPRLKDTQPATAHGRRVMLVYPEPQHHGLDLRINADWLSRSGWDVLYQEQNLPALIEVAQREWFAMLMIVMDEGRAHAVASIIRALRRAACNPDVKVLVLSESLARRPDRLARLGADAAAANISLACTQARRLFALLPVQI